MRFLQRVFSVEREIKCPVCGNTIKKGEQYKTEYIKIKGCYGTYIIHIECNQK